MYLSVATKYVAAFIFAIFWSCFSVYLAQRWIIDLTELSNAFLTWFIIGGIAIIPGFMNAFIVLSLLLDNRPPIKNELINDYPPITILIAAYNEAASIQSTLESISKQEYPGELVVFVINDGSTDNTAELVNEVLPLYSWLQFINLTKNAGKANALNVALAQVKTELTITIDGDSYLFKNALVNIIGRYLSDPPTTVAVAGAILVRNSRENLVTQVQEWDYFCGIAATKRLQSLFQGTLVAQGAFSVYQTKVLRELNGWQHVVGEDIVLTWAILERGHRVGFAENACLFTNAPTTWHQFFKQRQRWSRGLIEAFKVHWRLLFKARFTTLFIWWNLLFPWMDLAYTFAFIPGIILAFFGYFWIAGPLTLILLPMALCINYLMYSLQLRMFNSQGLKVRKNVIGFILYAFFYSIILQPACVMGYIHEIFKGSKKTWGTK